MVNIIQAQLQRHPDIMEQAVEFMAALSWNQS